MTRTGLNTVVPITIADDRLLGNADDIKQSEVEPVVRHIMVYNDLVTRPNISKGKYLINVDYISVLDGFVGHDNNFI